MSEGGGSNVLGEALRRHRRDRRISGAELANCTGVTQGTISKFERGRLVPDLDFLSRFAHSLRLQKNDAADLMELAGAVPEGVTPQSVLQYLPVDFLQVDWAQRRQETVALAESKAKCIKVFNPLVVPGLLQTEDYARHIIALAGESRSESIERAVQARMSRQKAFQQSSQRAEFILMESSLAARVAPSAVLRKQIDHLCALAQSKKIAVVLIPQNAELPLAPPPGFYLFDERVYIELPHGDLWLLSRSNVSGTYRRLFENFRRCAISGDVLIQRLSHIRDFILN